MINDYEQNKPSDLYRYNYSIDYGSGRIPETEPDDGDGDYDNQTEDKKDKKPVDGKFRLIVTQLVICAFALLAAFCFKILPDSVYLPVREKYAALFEDKTSVSEVLGNMAEKLNMSSSADKAVTESYSVTVSEIPVPVSQPESVSSQESAVESKTDAENLSEKDFLPINSEPVDTVSVPAAVTTVAAKTQSQNMNQMAVPVKGEITSGFGYRLHPIYGSMLFHSGIDIGADEGSEISAALDGQVNEAGYSSSYGNYLIISHSDSVKTVYGHCSKLLKSSGDSVKKGEIIALVGSTGVSTGPHLHFEVRVGGICIDPRWVVDL